MTFESDQVFIRANTVTVQDDRENFRLGPRVLWFEAVNEGANAVTLNGRTLQQGESIRSQPAVIFANDLICRDDDWRITFEGPEKKLVFVYDLFYYKKDVPC